jgi:hypothetical protein
MKREIYSYICAPLVDVIARMDHIGNNYHGVLGLFLDNLTIHLYGQDEMIYRRGDYADRMHVLLEGDICILSHDVATSSDLPGTNLKLGTLTRSRDSVHIQYPWRRR